MTGYAISVLMYVRQSSELTNVIRIYLPALQTYNALEERDMPTTLPLVALLPTSPVGPPGGGPSTMPSNATSSTFGPRSGATNSSSGGSPAEEPAIAGPPPAEGMARVWRMYLTPQHVCERSDAQEHYDEEDLFITPYNITSINYCSLSDTDRLRLDWHCKHRAGESIWRGCAIK